MQQEHDLKLPIDARPPRRVYWDGQGRVSLPWEAKALDGLELPDVSWGIDGGPPSLPMAYLFAYEAFIHNGWLCYISYF